MNVLDENIPSDQRAELHRRRLPLRQIGFELGETGMGDDDIIPLLHRLPRSTFFTRDRDYYLRHLCHHNYCLIDFRVEVDDFADYVLRVLKHSQFHTQRKRSGKVLRITYAGIR
jgi:hypothetical protein